MATPTIRQVIPLSVLYTASNKTATVTTGTGGKATDLLVFLYGLDYGDPNQTDGPSPVGSWTQRASASNSNNAPHLKMWTRYAGTDGAQTITISSTDQYADQNIVVLVIADPHPTDPVGGLDISSGYVAGTATVPANHVAPSVTPVDPDELLICAWETGPNANDYGNYTAPTGMAKQAEVDSPPYSTLAVATQPLTANTATGTRTAQFVRNTSPTTKVTYSALSFTLRGKPQSVRRDLASQLDVRSEWTATKRVGLNYTSPVTLESGEVPAKRVQLATASQMDFESVWASTKDVRTLPAGGPIDLSIWAVSPDGTYLGPLPDMVGCDLSPITNDAGSVRISYPSDGTNFDILHSNITEDRDLEIAIWIGGREEGGFRAVLSDSEGDEVDEDAVWTFSGYFLNGRMIEALVYPADLITVIEHETETTTDANGNEVTTTTDKEVVVNPNREHVFENATAGTILATFMAAAHDRGTLTDVSFDSFTSRLGSNGVPFSQAATMLVGPGQDLLKVLGDLVTYGLCDWEINANHQLRLYEPGTLGRDLTQSYPPIVLRAAKDLTDSPRKHSVRASGTTMLGSGKDGIYAEQSDDDALIRRGRRIELFASAGNIDDEVALGAYLQNNLAGLARGTMELSQGLAFAEGGPLPFADFRLHDWVFSDNGNGNERYKVRQITLSQDEHGELTGAVTLNDLTAEWNVALAARLAALESGTTIAGTSNPSSKEDDTTSPNAPTGVIASSIAYQNPSTPELTEASVRVGWTAPTFNIDDTVADDIDSYEVQYRYLGLQQVNTQEPIYGTGNGAWQSAGRTNASARTHDFAGIAANTDIEVHVRAIDKAGNQSPWSSSFGFTTAADTTPPPIPSPPTVTEYLGTLRIAWDGLTADQLEMTEQAPDFERVEVYLSKDQDYTPGPATHVGQLFGPDGVVISDLEYEVAYHARFVALDRAGNASAPSTDGVGIPFKLLNDDLFANCVGTEQLQDLVVVNSKIANLAVSDAKIQSLSVGKLTAGVMTAQMILGGSIKTGLDGARIEMDGTGFRQYNKLGQLRTQFLAADGSALITGTVRSAMSGKRWEMQPDGSLRLYPDTGSNFSQLANYGNDVVWRGPLNTDRTGNRLNINLEGIGMNYSSEDDLTTLYSEMVLRKADVRLTSPFINLSADQRFAPNGGGLNRIQFTMWDTSGSPITNHIAHYRIWNSSSTAWSFPGRNVNLIATTGLSTNRFVLAYNDGNNADLQCGNVYAPNVVSPSGIASKENITAIPYEPLAVIRGARATQWQYKPDAEGQPALPPDEGAITEIPVTRRKKGRKSDRSEDQETVQVATPTGVKDSRRTARRRVGPMADDIEKLAPHMVERDNDGNLQLSMGDQIGVLWAAVGELADRLDSVLDRFSDLPQLPGAPQ